LQALRDPCRATSPTRKTDSDDRQLTGNGRRLPPLRRVRCTGLRFIYPVHFWPPHHTAPSIHLSLFPYPQHALTAHAHSTARLLPHHAWTRDGAYLPGSRIPAGRDAGDAVRATKLVNITCRTPDRLTPTARRAGARHGTAANASWNAPTAWHACSSAHHAAYAPLNPSRYRAIIATGIMLKLHPFCHALRRYFSPLGRRCHAAIGRRLIPHPDFPNTVRRLAVQRHYRAGQILPLLTTP